MKTSTSVKTNFKFPIEAFVYINYVQTSTNMSRRDCVRVIPDEGDASANCFDAVI